MAIHTSDVDRIGDAVLDLRRQIDPLDDSFRVLDRPSHVLPAMTES